ncbi:hypothetical protein J6590_086498 [Homalodisca vitripennis]|nr:hypothetical protein J6590_086498 [Homalodisca vitripennis]
MGDKTDSSVSHKLMAIQELLENEELLNFQSSQLHQGVAEEPRTPELHNFTKNVGEYVSTCQTRYRKSCAATAQISMFVGTRPYQPAAWSGDHH